MRAQSFVLACLLGLIAPVAAAQQDRYDVEIIVFEHTDSAAVAEEHWRAAIVAPEFERAGLLDNAGGGDGGLPSGFEALPAREGQLTDSAKKLERSNGYRLLRHLRWRQPALEPDQSVPVRVRAGDAVPITTPVSMLQRPVPSRGNRRARVKPDDAEGDGTAAGAEDPSGERARGERTDGAPASADGPDATGDYGYIGPYGPRERTVAVHPLDGTVELVVSRYLHLHVDLYRTAAVDWRPGRRTGKDEDESGSGNGDDAEDGTGDAAEAGGQPLFRRAARGPDGETMLSFPFRQSRRMRSGKLHYIDHPRLGVLVLITPYEEEEDGEDGAATGGDA